VKTKFTVGTLLTRKPGKSMPVDCVAEIFMVVEVLPNEEYQILEGDEVRRWVGVVVSSSFEKLK